MLEDLVNHVALPERVPDKEEKDISLIGPALTERLLQASRTFRDFDYDNFQSWDDLRRVLLGVKQVNRDGPLDRTALVQTFRQLEPGGFIILHIKKQNAGMLVSRHLGDINAVFFEAFEASPRSEDVLSAPSALVWDFPGITVAVPYAEFADESFQEGLAGILQQSSAESISQFAARAHKSGSAVVEIRDTTDPAVITQMVMTALEAYGRQINPQLLRKRVRDDVCWSDGAEVPWRRCPFWLVLRVGVARYLCMMHGGESGRARYKFLMCLFIASLLRDSVDVVSVQVLHNLRAKLARRLAKLETKRRDCSPAASAVHKAGFSALDPFFQSSLQMASDHIESVWMAFRRKFQRPIRPLPCRAELCNLELSLPKSGAYLETILLDPFPADRRYCPPARFDGSAVNQVSRSFASRYWHLNEIEHEIESGQFHRSVQGLGDEEVGSAILDKIDGYLKAVGSAYESMGEQKSFMILTIMELWMMIDEHATDGFSLLLDYHPAFSPESLDVLHLPRYVDMCRLQRIQSYLSGRIRRSGRHAKTIFEDPSRGCFAERYYDECDDRGDLRRLHQRVEEHAERMRRKKEQELETLDNDSRDLEQRIAESACIYIQDGIQSVHDDRGCRRCYLWRKRRRMRVKIHEHPLPTDPTQSKAVVFELRCPLAFAAYRSATWAILSSLAYGNFTGSATPRLSLQDYKPLRPFMGTLSGRICLSSTRKSFLDTHYCWVSIPADANDVFLPNGLRLGYYDPSTKAWPGRQSGRPSFAHHCLWALQPNSALKCLVSSPSFTVDSDGPSSHEIVASQTMCPAGLSVHEFMAFQGLFAGKYRRWPSILVELGSSNLNFSKQETTAIVAQLAAQAGPASNSDPLRIVHGVFREETFCTRLLEQISHRLITIASNWRETNLMDLLLTLLLRLTSLAPEPVAAKALDVLEAARDVTNRWVRQLRVETHKAKDSGSSRTCSRYALWAALLCRRTYAGSVEECGELGHMQPDATQRFVEASIALQENLINDPETLPDALKQAIVRDVRMRFRIRGLVRKSIEYNPSSLTDAIDTIWPLSKDDQRRSYSEPHFLGPPYHWWVELRVSGNSQARQQTVHYEMIEGHLLIDQKPLGRLPEEHRSSSMLEELFGKQNLLTYPSCLRGMTYMLGFIPNEHQIHVGFRNGSLIIRACLRGAVLELIPKNTFGEFSQMDLPASLVENCVHWLDVQTGLLEVRQSPEIWIRKPSNWIVDVRSRTARRRNSVLVDPHSPLFQQVARVFHRFEHPARLTVYQPNDTRRNLSVELRRLELNFVVNDNNLLYCKELKAEVDPDQDAGTWYGLDSKIVVRDAANPRRRSILVPMGPLSYSRNRCHVAVCAQNVGDYGIFAINDVLGRLDCPNESRLLYLKAQLHAYTSFILPDPLTRRTGTEEALECLRSGLCQPWMPINPNFSHYLCSLAKLTPRRVYYPKGLKSMQQVFWDPDLTTNIQDDRFLPVVSWISEKSASLSIFTPKDVELKLAESHGDAHLSERSHGRRRAFWPSTDDLPAQSVLDTPYDARDRCVNSEVRARVYEAVSLIRLWDVRFSSQPDLVALLQGWPNIQGHGRTFNKMLLSDLINVDFSLEWGSLVDFCRRSNKEGRRALSFLFAVMSFRSDLDADVIRMLVAYAVSDSLKGLEPPNWPSYSHFRYMQAPSVEYLLQLMNPLRVPCGDAERIEFGIGGKLRRKLEREQREREQRTGRDAMLLAEFLVRQWPCAQPTLDGLDGSHTFFLDASQALEAILPEWLRLFQNWELSEYIKQAKHTLDRCNSGPPAVIPPICIGDPEIISGGPGNFDSPRLREELRKPYRLLNVTRSDRLPPEDGIASSKPTAGEQKATNRYLLPEVRELEEIVAAFTISPSTVRQSYGRDLKRSVDALKLLGEIGSRGKEITSPPGGPASILAAQNIVWTQFGRVREGLEAGESRAAWLKQGGLWPCISPVTLLEMLRSNSGNQMGPGWKDALIDYAVSITDLQRLLRMDDASRKGDQKGVEEERGNLGHRNWDPADYPDWLLLEIDANILIRPDQVNVALATASPPSGRNSVLQMNMGQGKTSCIMPMVAAILADSKRLLRVIVPKALLLQTAQILQARLGNLLGREVRHVPFSRRTVTTADTVRAFSRIHRDILRSSGVIVALPEHLMSFELSGIQRLSDGRLAEAIPMIKAQRWLRRTCRDVLDECDFTLAVRTQLIYPSGHQANVDGHPHRWELVEFMLKLVEGHLWNLRQKFPRSIEVVHRQEGGFPWMFFLRKDAEEALVSRLVEDVVRGRFPMVPLQDRVATDLKAVKSFISEPQVDASAVRRVEAMFPDKHVAKKSIYQLRGLLVHRILLLTLKKRWNVQYGLHPLRDPIAVPYHAKGVPSDQAEWGHPDVAILFTCLSFYFAGLTPAQLRQSLQCILKADDPASEYDRWIESVSSLPGPLREWNVINVDDEVQMLELWEYFRHSVVVIDHFLNHSVFPRHAKQFQVKIQASGWDIPLFAPQGLTTSRLTGAATRSLTTGFSGTNDSRTMLPLTIEQDDLPVLLHTNADVLTYLLQPRNRDYFLAANTNGKRVSELGLLHILKNRGIRMLIDAGAQILEMDNFALAKAWMRVDTDAKAALYFNSDNKPFILYRNGVQVPLLASPFADDLKDCLVYLDEAHTRGTDLKMPADARGALTLGLGQTKDHTVQAAMRLRQLASSQSVVFFATPEVHQSILDHNRKDEHSHIDSRDVVCWLLEQTCSGIEQLQPLYYSQGMDFCRRAQAEIDHPDYLCEPEQLESYLKEMHRKEHHILEQMYQPKGKLKSVDTVAKSKSPEIAAFRIELNRRRRNFQDIGAAVHGSALQEVEQEREVTQEVEAVREVQKPSHATPLTYGGLHRDIITFTQTGRLVAGSASCGELPTVMDMTATGQKYRLRDEPVNTRLLVSKEFMKAVALKRPNDIFLRPVSWILWSHGTNTALVVSPEEAEDLIPRVREMRSPCTYLLIYAAPVTRKMLHFSRLDYYSIPELHGAVDPPRWMQIEIGLFAGRLYFDYKEYGSIMEYFGLLIKQEEHSTGVEDAVNHVGHSENREPGAGVCFTIQKSTTKTLEFLREWLAVRRRGQDLTHTPMGFVCQGKPLSAEHPFFSKSVEPSGLHQALASLDTGTLTQPGDTGS